jgi:hypothetical protein
MPRNDFELAIEHPEHFEIMINGWPFLEKAKGWWVDPSIQTIPLARKKLVKGKNEIELKTGFREDMAIEAIYLLGDFGVTLEGTQKRLGRLPAKLAAGDVTTQGLPFYGGAITYKVEVPTRPIQASQLFIETPQFEAACVKAWCGAESAQIIAWPPYEAPVASLPAYRRTVQLETVLTRRNTFGPLHQVPLKAAGYGPNNWITQGKAFSQEYMLYPSGLLAPPVASWRVAAQAK